eukprot:COSAG04_NODE_1584_length_6243_cov_3.623698_5_plen_49_part_00
MSERRLGAALAALFLFGGALSVLRLRSPVLARRQLASLRELIAAADAT